MVVTACHVQEAELKQWIETNGGYWVDDSLRQGVFEHGRAAVYVFLSNEYFDELEADDILDIEQQLVAPAASAVCFTISRAPGSEELTREIVGAFQRKWPGIIHPPDSGGAS